MLALRGLRLFGARNGVDDRIKIGGWIHVD